MKIVSNLVILVLVTIASFSSFAQSSNNKTVKLKEKLSPILVEYQNGNYQKALKELNTLESQVDVYKVKEVKGLFLYWKGLINIKLNEFDDGIKFLSQAIKAGFDAEDIHYEYGQALYVAEKLKQARLAFRQSVKTKYKVGVSLYYIAYISQQLKDMKKAVGFYNMIEKLPKEQKKDVLQASRMQIADIYLAQVEKLPNSFNSVKKYVLPQYEKALEVDKKSKLADEIRSKIREIQRRYEILVFQMRNGRPTAFPRYFIRGNISYNIDDNVTDTSNTVNDALETKDFASAFSNAGLYSRYSFYPNSRIAIAPELTLNYTKYFSDSDNIKPFNNFSATAGVQFNYEHTYNKAPATTYLNIDYTNRMDDSNADDTLEKASDTSSITISEEVQIFIQNPSTFRYRFTQSDAVDESLSFTSHSFIYEQVLAFSSWSVYLFNSLDISEFENNTTNNTTALTTRADFLLPSFYEWFNPNLFASYTLTDYKEDSDRGQVSLASLGFTLIRPISTKYFLNLSYTLDNQSGDQDSDSHSGSVIGLNLEYYY